MKALYKHDKHIQKEFEHLYGQLAKLMSTSKAPIEATTVGGGVSGISSELSSKSISSAQAAIGEEDMYDFYLEIAKGNIPGHSIVNKFGANPLVTAGTTEDIWDGGGTYSFPTTADITHIRQAVNQATMLGKTIEIQGLNADWELVMQTVNLDATNTTTPVELGTALIRVFRMKVLADVVTTQDIQLRNVGGGTTYAVIQAGNNQTLMAIYTVPVNKTAYMTQYYCDNTPSATKQPDSVEAKVWVADRINSYEFQLKHARGIPISGDGFTHMFKPYFKINEKSDIKISATVEGGVGDDATPHAGFDLILIDN